MGHKMAAIWGWDVTLTTSEALLEHIQAQKGVCECPKILSPKDLEGCTFRYLCEKPYAHNFEHGNKKHGSFHKGKLSFAWYAHITKKQIEFMKTKKISVFCWNDEIGEDEVAI